MQTDIEPESDDLDPAAKPGEELELASSPPREPAEGAPEETRRFVLWVSILAVLGVLAALPFLGAPPPSHLTIACGPGGGTYEKTGRALARSLEASGIQVDLLGTAGSGENIEMLRSGQADLGFAQGGMIPSLPLDLDPGEEPGESGLVGIASLYLEPLWIFVRSDHEGDGIGGLRGCRIEVGAEGSGTRAVARTLLEPHGLLPSGCTLLGSSPQDAVASLIEGSVDALFLVTSPRSGKIRELLGSPAVRALPLVRNAAYGSHFRFLKALTLPPGLVDLDIVLPREPLPILAPTATLLAREELHPSIVPLLIRTLEHRSRSGGLLEEPGQFPAPHPLDVPIAPAALGYFENGTSFLYRWLPFQFAATLDRLKILLLPLLTLLIPLFRLAPPIYRWRIRSRIYRWYAVVLQLERRIQSTAESKTVREQVLTTALDELSDLRREISEVNVPLSYAEELYNLRMHINMVSATIRRRLSDSSAG